MNRHTIVWILRSEIYLAKELLFLRNRLSMRWAARTMLALARELVVTIASA